MERHARFTDLVAKMCVAVALVSFASSCGRTTPTAPTIPFAGAGPGSPSDASHSFAGTTNWSCLTASRAGIFGSAAPGCSATALVPSALGRLAGQAVPGPSGNLSATVSGSTVTLTWSAPTSPDPATSYVIEAGSSSGATNIASFDTTNPAAALTVTNVPAGTYYVRVRAANIDGPGAASNEVTIVVTTGGSCSTPSVPSGLTSSVTGSSLSLSWTAPASGCAPTGYVIEAGSTPGSSNLAYFNTGSTATSFAAAGVGAGTYYVRVRAANGSSAGGPSNEVTLIVGGSTAPTSVTGRWVGVTPDGMIVELNPQGQCPGEYDLQLNLASSGTALTGTGTTRLRVTPCRDVLGEVATWPVVNGTVGSGTISFDLGHTGSHRFSGTFTATRMTGTFVITQPVGPTLTTQTGSFAVSRQ